MNILFLDIGFRNTGVFIAEILDKGYKPVYYDVIKTKKENKIRNIRASDDDIRCSILITRELCRLIEGYNIVVVAVELPHGGSKSQKASKSMGIVTGIIAAIEEFLRIPFIHVSPSDVKIAMSGNRFCSKKDIQEKAISIYKEFKKFRGNTKEGFIDKFEHIADAVGVSEAVSNDPIIRLLRQGN